MVFGKAQLRRRLELSAGGRMRHEEDPRTRPAGVGFSAALRALLAGANREDRSRWGEFGDLPLPDLLSPSASSQPDRARFLDLLDLAFLGRASAGEMDAVLNDLSIEKGPWEAAHFADDLFLDEFVRQVFAPRIHGEELVLHRGFVARVLANPPIESAAIHFRQGILVELEEESRLNEAVEDLALEILRLLTLLRASRDDARLEPVRFRLDVLRSFRSVVGIMTDSFGEASSGLSRLYECASVISRSRGFGRLEALLDHDESMARLDLEVTIGGDGRLRHLEIRGLQERRRNVFFRRPLRRWWDRLRVLYHRYRLGADELVDQLVMSVYQQVAPAMVRVIQTLCHLEVFLASRALADQARSRGLAVCLPEITNDGRLELEGLFNPLLLAITDHPVASDLMMDIETPVTLVTGPNSGGKTRLLQAVGIAQILGQSGFYAPCRCGRLPLVQGLFASIVEMDRADQSEGRLGTEMVRLRKLFENAPAHSLILIDELCSGTNPSEAIEIVETVLRMLQRIEPVAFVTTHFLDFATQLERQPLVGSLRFLQAEVDPDLGATYRFLPGVASTSLAVGTARRLGITFDELERKLDRATGKTARVGRTQPL